VQKKDTANYLRARSRFDYGRRRLRSRATGARLRNATARASRPVSDVFFSMDAHTRSLEEQLCHEERSVEARTRRIEELRAKADAMEGRHTIRARIHLEDTIAATMQRIADIESGEHRRRVEERLAPYLRASEVLETRDRARKLPAASRDEREPVQADVPATRVAGRDECQLCGHPLILLHSKALMCCSRCGCSTPFIDVTNTSCQGFTENSERCEQTYKRINHFNEWLCSIQNKSSVVIGEDILRSIMVQLQRERIPPSAITHRKLREILKSMPTRKKAYEHVTQIHAKLTGQPAPMLTPQIEEMCRVMFSAVNQSFDKHCPKDRTNFLSYPYCLFKFFQLLGFDQRTLNCFTLLKGKDKLQKQDQIFKAICEDLRWEWIQTV
jgi:HAMP domain-containing protein